MLIYEPSFVSYATTCDIKRRQFQFPVATNFRKMSLKYTRTNCKQLLQGKQAFALFTK